MSTATKTADTAIRIFLASLQEEVERLNMVLEDQIEATKLAVDMRDRTEFRCAELEAKLQQEQAWRTKQEDTTWKLGRAESEIIKLGQDLKTEINNRDHFRSLVAQQDACINLAKQKVKEFLEAADREKKNAEHLARKAIELQQENAKLKEAAKDAGTQAEMASQVPTLLEENRKYREQTTRLVEEKRQLEEQLRDLECEGCRTGEMGAYCGGCLGCMNRQMDKAMCDMDKALHDANVMKDTYMPVTDFKQNVVNKLLQTLRDLRDRWPFTLPTKSKLISDALTYASVSDRECEKRFEEMRKRLSEKNIVRVNIPAKK